MININSLSTQFCWLGYLLFISRRFFTEKLISQLAKYSYNMEDYFLRVAILTTSVMIIFTSCNRKDEVKEIEEVSCACSGEPPPPAPPIRGQILGEGTISVNNYGEKMNFNVKVVCEKSFYYEQSQLQTFMVIANNGRRKDSFYFGFPEKEYLFSSTIKLVKNKSNFDIGYTRDGNFKVLYKVTLGDTLNATSIHLFTPEKFKRFEDNIKLAKEMEKENL